ncbi:TPA: hypothetical protein HA259_03085, partial [Thermoplasmata archaeon]|nr:hypothetical protein [Thermoplasmata archaeon]
AFFEALGDELVVALQVASVAVYAILAILSYRLVQRDNEHFEREKKLRTEIMSFVSRSRGEGSAADLPRNSERRRSPLFWFTVVIMPEILLLLALVTTAIAPLEEEQAMAQVILGWMFFVALATPFLGLQFYMFCFLNADMSGHHKRWTGLVKDTKLFLASTGYMAGTVPEPEPLPERSNGVYAIVSLLSSGLFFFYWWYVITKDGNDHIKHHEIFEREILDLLSKRPSTDRAAQAFGSGPDISPPVNA